MRKLFQSCVLSAALMTGFSASAQDMFAKVETNKQVDGDMSTRSNEKKDAIQARKSLMGILNQFREYTTDGTETDKTSGSFKDYLDKINASIAKRLENLSGSDNATATQRAKLLGGKTMLMSAKCLEGQDQNSFVQGKDMDGNILISFPVDSLRKSTRFGTVENYREGFARVRKDQVFGYLNLCGEEVITAQYARAESFTGGRALVKRVEWYFVDAKGDESEALLNILDGRALSNGVNLVKMLDGKQAMIDNRYDLTRKPISQFYDEVAPFYQNAIYKVRLGNKVGLIGLDGKVRLEASYDKIENTKVAGVYKVSVNNMVGLMDTSWTVKIQPTFTTISEFNQFGLAMATNEKGSVLIQKNTFKTTKNYETISDFNEFGVASFRDENKKYGLIDSEMKIVFGAKYATIGAFNEIGLAQVSMEANKFGFVKFDGTEQIKAIYESVSPFNSFGLTVARMANGKSFSETILDRTGNVIVAATEEAIAKKLHFTLTDSILSGHYIVVNATEDNAKDISYLLIEKNNLKQVTATTYESINSIDQVGNFRVKKGEAWGIIDSVGTVLTKCQYKEIRRLGEGYYAAQNEKGMWGFLNKKGKPQIEFEYEEVRQYRNGFAPVSKGKNKWGIINKFNAKIVPCVFKNVTMNGAETKFEITDVDGTVFLVSEKGDCETNCAKFEQIRNKANKTE